MEEEQSPDSESGAGRSAAFSDLFRSEAAISQVDLRLEVADRIERYVHEDEDIELTEKLVHAWDDLSFVCGSRTRTVEGNYERITDTTDIFLLDHDSFNEEVRNGTSVHATLESEVIMGGGYLGTVLGPFLKICAWNDFLRVGRMGGSRRDARRDRQRHDTVAVEYGPCGRREVPDRVQLHGRLRDARREHRYYGGYADEHHTHRLARLRRDFGYVTMATPQVLPEQSSAEPRWTAQEATTLDSLLEVAGWTRSERTARGVPWEPGHELHYSAVGGMHSHDRRRISVAGDSYSSRVDGDRRLAVAGDMTVDIDSDTVLSVGPSGSGQDRLHVKGDMSWHFHDKMILGTGDRQPHLVRARHTLHRHGRHHLRGCVPQGLPRGLDDHGGRG